MYTIEGRILSKKEAQQAVDLIKQARGNREVCDLEVKFVGEHTRAKITVMWERAEPGMGNWESVGVNYVSKDESVNQDEVFDTVDSFAEAYHL